MALTQETIMIYLLKRDGKAKNSEFLSEFKGPLNCSDLAEKKQNRDLFKTFVNNVAVVKEIDGEKHIVLKKRYSHLLKEIPTLTDQRTEFGESSDASPDAPAELSGPCDGEGNESSNLAKQKENSNLDNSNASPLADTDCGDSNSDSNSDKEPSPVERALQRSRDMDSVRLHTGTQNVSSIQSCKVLHNSLKDNEAKPSVSQAGRTDGTAKSGATAPQKPYMLPLRMPPPPARKVIADVPEPGAKDKPPGTVNHGRELDRSPRTKRRPFEELQPPGSPHPRRCQKSAKPAEEAKYSATVPLESKEHEWLVKSAAGHWSQVHGLLLRDAELGLKKDFMSGFTALHWAAKGGHCEMVRTIVELCRRGRADFDVDARSHGGYTALHVAAIHDRRAAIVLLARDFGADVHVRDNGGKKARHYLRADAPDEVRELLGEPRAEPRERPQERDGGDEHLADVPRGLGTIGRLFQPHAAGPRRRHRQRPGFLSVTCEDVEDEGEESPPRNRSFSDLFKHGALAPH
ncbi:ankyrin repeat domain-containing protein SOWAHA-like [Anguilla rostrata]|uniref:ankyrin repeat domain-containing protein SOWAHA-like n=1 Tax=Anguilla rostrata TaxID=7938 RepID=UPI0030CD810F